MTKKLTDLQHMLQVGNTITADDADRAADAIDDAKQAMRMAGRRIGRTFGALCETFATLDMDKLPSPLREQIEAVVLGRHLPEADATGPVTPMELLQLSHLLVAMGEREQAARLRRLADDLVARPPPSSTAGAWTEADIAKPWGAEVAFLLNLATDPALNDEQLVMLTHCAKRIEATAHIGLNEGGAR